MIQSTVWTLVVNTLRQATCMPRNGSELSQRGSFQANALRRAATAGRRAEESDAVLMEALLGANRIRASSPGDRVPRQVRTQRFGFRVRALRMAANLRSLARRRTSHGFS